MNKPSVWSSAALLELSDNDRKTLQPGMHWPELDSNRAVVLTGV